MVPTSIRLGPQHDMRTVSKRQVKRDLEAADATGKVKLVKATMTVPGCPLGTSNSGVWKCEDFEGIPNWLCRFRDLM